MARYSKHKKASEQTQADAMAVARSIQKPGQTKEQTKLIAQGIQKGIEIYKKQQKAKARELDKRLKNAAAKPQPEVQEPVALEPPAATNKPVLPWILLAVSWALFALYIFLTR